MRVKIVYGQSTADQYGWLSLPQEPAYSKMPIVVVFHGGFWRPQYGLDLMFPIVDDLLARGYAVWNVEYRRLDGHAPYRSMLDDVDSAIVKLGSVGEHYCLDFDRLAFVGHSAGGHLALWGASKSVLAPKVTIGLAPVVDLSSAAEANLGNGAVQTFLGGTATEVPENYKFAQPALDTNTVLIHGSKDDTVPVSQSLNAETAGIEVIIVEGATHFDVIDPTTKAWSAALQALDKTFATPC